MYLLLRLFFVSVNKRSLALEICRNRLHGVILCLSALVLKLIYSVYISELLKSISFYLCVAFFFKSSLSVLCRCRAIETGNKVWITKLRFFSDKMKALCWVLAEARMDLELCCLLRWNGGACDVCERRHSQRYGHVHVFQKDWS